MQKKSFMSVKFRSTVLKLISSVIDKGLFLRGIDVNSYGAWTGQGDKAQFFLTQKLMSDGVQSSQAELK